MLSSTASGYGVEYRFYKDQSETGYGNLEITLHDTVKISTT